MELSRIYFASFCCLTFVMDSHPHQGDQNQDARSILDGYSVGYASFIENRHRFLKTQQIHNESVYDSMKCGLDCLVTVGCRSFNFRMQADIEGKHLCELLASDKFHHSKRFQPSAEYHHYSISNPCDYAPCQHGSTCHPLYETHGFVCRCVHGYIGEVCDIKVPSWREVNTREVCFGARDDTYGAFKMQYSGNMMSFKLVYLSGHLTCGSDWSSYWGCDKGQYLRTVVTDDSNAVVFPQVSFTTKYTISGMHSDSPALTFNNLTVSLKVLSGQEFRVWYEEDLENKSEHDNGGKTCMKIYALYV